MSFDLKDYVTVAERMRAFYKAYPEGSLQLDPVQITMVEGKTWAIGRAYAYRDRNDDRPGIGTAWEIVPGTTPYTRGSELQNLETSCWGRALAAIGIGIDRGVATADEVRAAKAREGAWERVESPRENDPFYHEPPPPKAVLHRRISDKQVGLLRGRCRGKEIPDDQVVQVINTILGLAGRNHITVIKELTNEDLDLVLEGLEKVDTVQGFLDG
jgi:hypothetical protein